MTVGENETQNKSIRLSVIVASLDCQSDLTACLESILSGRTDEVEVIVVDRCSKNLAFSGLEKHSEINFILFPRETNLPTMLSKGIALSTGVIIAITDSNCTVDENWISSIFRSHQAESPVIGGSVEIRGKNCGLTCWAAYFCDYGQFMLPAEPGIVNVIPGNNFSIKRRILAKGTEFVEKEFWKTHWCRKLQSEGVKLISEPATAVRWGKSYTLIPYLIKRFYQGRCFAGIRVSKESLRKRIYYSAGSVILPLILSFRTISSVLRKRHFSGKLLLSSPIIFLAVLSWSAGEMVGYMAGAGNSCRSID